MKLSSGRKTLQSQMFRVGDDAERCFVLKLSSGWKAGGERLTTLPPGAQAGLLAGEPRHFRCGVRRLSNSVSTRAGAMPFLTRRAAPAEFENASIFMAALANSAFKPLEWVTVYLGSCHQDARMRACGTDVPQCSARLLLRQRESKTAAQSQPVQRPS